MEISKRDVGRLQVVCSRWPPSLLEQMYQSLRENPLTEEATFWELVCAIENAVEQRRAGQLPVNLGPTIDRGGLDLKPVEY